ncbi:MAG: cell wall hydrolase [Lachnospiraceae bacterium]|nr:cell wall hydrolase [Lachnospiraceae bacterium]
MNLKRNFLTRAKQTGAIALAAGVIVGSIAINETKPVKADERVTAGVSTLISDSKYQKATASLAANTENSVSENDENQSVDTEWANRLMTTVDDHMNVRANADSNSALVGKLRKGDVATFDTNENGWYHITSGNVNGYVNASYVVTGDDAKNLAKTVCETTATSKSAGLRVRANADSNSSIVTSLYEGQTVSVNIEANTVDGWVAVKTTAGDGFVNSDYVTVEQKMGTAITIEEEKAAIKAEEEKKAKEDAAKEASKEQATTQTTQTTSSNNSAYAINTSADAQTLMAAVIQCEAGNQPYEGKVAIGSVIMNRIRRGYASSVSGVVFQKNQFYPATSAKLARVISNGPNATCMQAAADALAGADMVNGCTSYRPVWTGRSGYVLYGHVFF